MFQAAFNAVMKMWNKKPLKVYGGRMSESMLAILSHIIKGEIIIKVSTRQFWPMFNDEGQDTIYFDVINLFFKVNALYLILRIKKCVIVCLNISICCLTVLCQIISK